MKKLIWLTLIGLGLLAGYAAGGGYIRRRYLTRKDRAGHFDPEPDETSKEKTQ